MGQFLDNTIYTSYALNKISENLSGKYSLFNFISVKIGSGDNTLDLDREDLSSTLYSLKIKKDDIVFEDNVLTIKCEIPPGLASMDITEIGLFDTYLGVQHLFSYSKVVVVKPSDLNYELTIVLNLGPRTIDFPGLTIIEITKCDYATQKDLDNFWNMFTYVCINLERIIHRNGEEIGKNKPQIVYKEQEEINEQVRNFTYANLNLTIQSKYSNVLKDLFFIDNPSYFAYNILNFAHSDSYLRTIEGLFYGVEDTISFHDGPCIFGITTTFSDLNNLSTVVNKKTPSVDYFSLDIQENIENYSMSKTAKYKELVFSIYAGMSSHYELRYIFDMDSKSQYLNQPVTYIITFNGNLNAPDFNLYINGIQPKIFSSNGIIDGTPKDLYGKMIKKPVEDMSLAPDYSREVPLKNYYEANNIKYHYDNAKGIKNIIQVKKQPTLNEIAFINTMLSKVY